MAAEHAISVEATAAPPPDCVLVECEPDAERVGECWYARDAHALLAAPDLPTRIAAELRAWTCMPDENVRRRRPFLVEDRDGNTAYVFDPSPLRQVPAWWRAAAQAWRAGATR